MMLSIIQKGKAFLKKIVGKLYIYGILLFKEHTYEGIRYLFIENKQSDQLLIFFSGFGAHYEKAVYNYIKTTTSIKSNKLWISDRYGYYQAGTYYLGEDFQNNDHIQRIQSLIEEKRKGKKVICCGSSKGGTAALYYGMLIGCDKIVVGSPQYLIGTYLEENDFYKGVKNDICPKAENVQILDELLPQLICSVKQIPPICLLYSSHERHYSDQLQPLIKQLRERCSDFYYEDKKFKMHSEVGNYYPLFLKEHL